MEALRSLTIKQSEHRLSSLQLPFRSVSLVRDYHRTYYAPYNLCLVIAGKVSISSLLNVLQDRVESSIANHHHSNPTHWKRPFVETATARRIRLSEMRREVVEFPEKDESTGELLMTFSGSAPNDYLTAKVKPLQPCYVLSCMIESHS